MRGTGARGGRTRKKEKCKHKTKERRKCSPLASEVMQSPKAERDLLIACVSFCRSPLALDWPSRSLPAKSTKFSTPSAFSPVSLFAPTQSHESAGRCATAQRASGGACCSNKLGMSQKVNKAQAVTPTILSWKTEWLREDRSFIAVAAVERAVAAVA